ncbi:MAG: zinc ABC transporter substrate-binding protein [Eubacterium sp.]|nr:zinc ABC transporter substrate-binding protein [Eubacterium sp.]
MIKRKWLAGLLTGALALGTITGCGSTPAESENDTTAVVDIEDAKKADSTDGNESTSGDASNASMKIVTTIFPEYDWVKTLLGDKAENADMTLLLDNGVDLHSYQPTAEDIVKIKECDMFVYVGGESDEWVEDVLASAENEDMVVINLLDVLGDSVKNEEIVEGMEHDHEDGEEHEDEDHEAGEEHEDADHEDGEEHEHEEEKDEHVWLSLKNASVLCEEIATQLGTIDEANKDYYMSNYEDYKTELEALDEEYQAAVDAGSKDTILFGDRFPFRYMVDDYGLNYYAAFAGCSAESEASFDTVIFLAGKVDELGLPAILTIEGADHDIAETVKENTKSGDQKILTMNSLQSTTSKDIEEGTTYLSVMRSNLDVLKEAVQ